tara:strand:- start:134 stop:556 length:423 start_codon:yes stop_codon:yes gene_type:complete
MKALNTYTMPRPFYGYNIPIAIQSSYLRDYASKNKMHFSLPVTEISKLNTFQMLSGILNDKKQKIKDLAFVSIFVLPLDDYKKLKEIFGRKAHKNINLHFTLESLILTPAELLEWQKENMPLIELTQDFSDFKSNNYESL